ncbi:MAG: catechol 1,2-dioxygenase [Saprospiraceae bacterium]
MERRDFIRNASLSALSMSAFGNLIWDGVHFVGDTPTTTDILGPFYRPGAPIRSNLRLPNTKGTLIILKGNILKEDGKTPLKNALVEIWHCDENEVYDNATDDYKYRGGQTTNANGKYEFKTILPVPYKADQADESSWRPAHIHMRISAPNQQDLITQIYFENGKYVESDPWASAPNAVNRILKITNMKSGESEVLFNVILGKEIPLDAKVYDKITGLYEVDDFTVEFIKSDDALFMKRNGQLVANLYYVGNNTFEGGGTSFPKVNFELLKDGSVKANISTKSKTFSGLKFLKY